MTPSKIESNRDLRKPISEYDRLTGIALLLAVGAVFLLVNFFCAPVTTLGLPSLRDVFLLTIYMVMGGLLMSEPAVLLIWLICGGGLAARRWALVTVGGLVLGASLYLGFSFSYLNIERPLWRQLDWVFSSPFMLVPLTVWSLGIPVVLCHKIRGWQLRKEGELVPRISLSTKDLFVLTGLSAFAIGAVQLFCSLRYADPQSRLPIWLLAGGIAVLAFGVSLLFIVTAIGCLMRERGFWFWFWIWPAATISATTGGLMLVFLFGFADFFAIPQPTQRFPDWIVLFAVWPLSYSMTLVIFLGGLRLLGYRLYKGAR